MLLIQDHGTAGPADMVSTAYCTVSECPVPKTQGVSCLEYDPTIPTRFMVGTDQGKSVLVYSPKIHNTMVHIIPYT